MSEAKRQYRIAWRTPWRKGMLYCMHAQGYSDAEIGVAIGVERRKLRDWRASLGLESNAYSDHRRQMVRERTSRQLEAAGLKSLAEVRAKRYRDFAANRGWPEDLAPRAVQILDALHDYGPMTRSQICDAIGFVKGDNQRKWLSTNRVPGHSCLADLQQRGLVIRLPNRVAVSKGQGNTVYVYALPLNVKRMVKRA